MNPIIARSGHPTERRSNVCQCGSRFGVEVEEVLLDHARVGERASTW